MRISEYEHLLLSVDLAVEDESHWGLDAGLPRPRRLDADDQVGEIEKARDSAFSLMDEHPHWD
jgi:hypothetical protein